MMNSTGKPLSEAMDNLQIKRLCNAIPSLKTAFVLGKVREIIMHPHLELVVTSTFPSVIARELVKQGYSVRVVECD
jgi:hypothetical protein